MGLTHGGELEVLPVLADRPELTHLELAMDASPMDHGEKSDAARRDPAVYYIPKDVRDMYESGWYGVIEDTSPERVAEVMQGVSARSGPAHQGVFRVVENKKRPFVSLILP